VTSFAQETFPSDQHRAAMLNCVGSVGHITADGEVWVDFPGNENGLVLARLATPDSGSIVLGAAVLLLFEGADAAKPIIVSVIRDSLEKATEVDAKVSDKREVTVDGRRVVLEGHDEVVLRCGKASITLRRDGKIAIRGVELLSRASGTNRIRGGSVAIN
jgi:hypothetical protein